MEVHAHTHTPRKKWHHYFWEFFMLFLAVTLGFLVENQREHFVEKKREKQYIRSMIEDLRSDTSSFNIYLNNQRIAAQAYDSVIFLLSQKNRSSVEVGRLYYLIRIGMRLNSFPEMNENTYEQMKSSGNLRLLHTQYINDSISKYYFNIKEAAAATSQLLLRQQSLLQAEGKLFNGVVFQNMINKKTFDISAPSDNTQLITDDRKIINECIVGIHYLYSITLYSENFTINQIDQAARLIQFLKKEYHLK
jgi:hypothetical protein